MIRKDADIYGKDPDQDGHIQWRRFIEKELGMLSVVSNLGAMNAQRQFNITGDTIRKSTEKLSSGYKINRAADDAAGLTISEKMRSLIRGMN